jgi:hypothetical protein
MNGSLRSKTSTIDIYIKLAQYPILCDQIRVRMREELFRRGITTQAEFEAAVKEKALESQRREGLLDPFTQEPANLWQKRKERIRDFHTDFYFGYNLPRQLLDKIIQEVLSNQPAPTNTVELTFNPELAPWELLFRQGEIYEALPPPEQEKVSHHLEEIKVVLIKGMISDQLPFIGVAKKAFTVSDLRRIYNRRIGGGKIGGKAAGMLLALKILQQSDPAFGPALNQQIEIPSSYFIGTEVIYDFRLRNNLDRYMNQKYRSLDEIRSDYPRIVDEHLRGVFPEKIIDQLREVLIQLGKRPLIVRSSSLLEDNFGYSFAGKYSSYFCPNQGNEEENLQALLDAIRRIYASSLNPDAILYRKQHGLIDYDERMAILLQTVQGQQYGRYFMSTVAGVGFSQNPFRWNPKIRRQDGFLRMVWGLGTRAVERVSNDYPRLVALSHPTLRPEISAKAIRQYSQHYVDVLDLEENCFKTVPVREILQADYPELRYIASIDRGDYIQEIVSSGTLDRSEALVLTFDYLVKDHRFVKLMRTALMRLEAAYGLPVDIEFALDIVPNYPHPNYKLHIFQCRPLSQQEDGAPVWIPEDIPEKDLLFSATNMTPDGKCEGIRYAIFVDPEVYHRISDPTDKLEIGRAIGRLNKELAPKSFILIGPGRWGSANLDLGVRVGYADIYNTAVLVEMAVAGEDGLPELSYGTHFFQDLVEAKIYALPLNLDADSGSFDWAFFRESPNLLAELSAQDADLAPYLRVIDIDAVAHGRRLNVLMDGSTERAVGYLAHGHWPVVETKVSASLSNF